MKVALHFDAMDVSLATSYGPAIKNHFFRLVLGTQGLDLRTKVFVGDLLWWKLDELGLQDSQEGVVAFDPKSPTIPSRQWLPDDSRLWRHFSPTNVSRG